jgi:hypothetical protein
VSSAPTIGSHRVSTPDGTVAPLWPEDKGARLCVLAERLGLGHPELAAVGDSIRDESLLRATARPFYVGDPLPEELADVPHFPDGNLLRIARELLGQELRPWTSRSEPGGLSSGLMGVSPRSRDGAAMSRAPTPAARQC